MNLFVSCFFGQNQERTKLCQEFVDKYPNVTLLQNGINIKTNNTVIYNFDEIGFIDYKMINAFLRTQKDFKSLTIIDSDLILPNNFFESINHPINFLSFLTYRSNFHLMNGILYKGSNSKIYNTINKFNNNQGHTGYILSFNKKFLENYQFPERFLSGYDYFLTCALLGKCIEGFEDQYKRIPKNTIINYIECDVIHNYHTPRENIPSWEQIAEHLKGV